MQPPPNNHHPFHQYLRKITAQTQPRPLATAPTATETANPNSPPPRYTPAIISHDFEDDYDEEFDEYEPYDFNNAPDYYPVQGTDTAANSTNPKTLTINLDSSITITGDGNTLAIASGQSQFQSHSKSQSNAPKSKLANTASAIIAALHQSGVSASASVEINIDAGVRVEGSRNIVCFGGMIVPGRVPARAGVAGAGVKTMNTQSSARKRRAQSEPAADTTETKKSKN
ncbi:hypothetical protein BDW69DRAFT_180168 [Aspergillus filifer]